MRRSVAHPLARLISCPAQEKKTLEERELEAKVSELNKEIAKAAEELTRASQVMLDTEAAAAEASLVAEQAAADARRIQEQYEARKRAEVEARKAEEERREAERRRREDEERRQEELRRAEEEKKAKLRKPEESKQPDWENWPTFTYTADGDNFSQGIGCIIRGDPDAFRESMAAIELVDPLEKKNLLQDYQELVSDIVKLYPAHGDEELQRPIYVAIPHCTSRSSAISREPVIKAEVDGKWEELTTQEVTFESKKATTRSNELDRVFPLLCEMQICKMQWQRQQKAAFDSYLAVPLFSEVPSLIRPNNHVHLKDS
ncbi:hypothetical protein LSH36_251g00049 [Paralvinella palmiformis]|uniref:Uncharacterized protein n=1 Tax=Paralvinella palmiformis TaxID=53620 RepID=A0AAD9JL56_9ANNE|nr:hypothetical protein LSH36_251g00049 [Paralvinella palmiformis]